MCSTALDFIDMDGAKLQLLMESMPMKSNTLPSGVHLIVIAIAASKEMPDMHRYQCFPH